MKRINGNKYDLVIYTPSFFSQDMIVPVSIVGDKFGIPTTLCSGRSAVKYIKVIGYAMKRYKTINKLLLELNYNEDKALVAIEVYMSSHIHAVFSFELAQTVYEGKYYNFMY